MLLEGAVPMPPEPADTHKLPAQDMTPTSHLEHRLTLGSSIGV